MIRLSALIQMNIAYIFVVRSVSYTHLDVYKRQVEATAEGKSIFAYDKGGKVAAAYEQFGKEVADIGEKQKKQHRRCV